MRLRKFSRYLIVGGLATTLFVALAPEAEATGPLDKAGRGLRNIVIAPLEIPVSMANEARKNPFRGLFLGPVIGVVNGVTRMVAGVVELATFFMPPFDRPLYDRALGETVWE